MKKSIPILIIGFLLIGFLSGCTSKPKYEKYDAIFFDTFDTVTQIVGYSESKEEFDGYVASIEETMHTLHRLYDKYNNYEGINNIKTINDNAGIQPVKVDKKIIDLILYSKKLYYETGEETNIALGAVLRIWSAYRDEAETDPNNAMIPPKEDLIGASKHTDINKVIVDEENSTVYLEDPKMSLDVGSIAKGYATELAAVEAKSKGFISGIISAGGNIRTIGKPLDTVRERWGIGIQNPNKSIVKEPDNILDTVFVTDASVVSSGDYQRYFVVDGKMYHHIIDPKTLMPGDHYRAVTIVTPDSGAADFLSTTVFLLPFEESWALVQSIDDLEALWVFKDGTVKATDGMKKIMKSEGATGAKAK